MGGSNSGRYGGRVTVERTQSIVLSIYDVMRGFKGMEAIGKSWRWSGEVPGSLTAIVRPQGSHYPLVELRYRFEHFSRDTGDQTQYVDVGYWPCHFGGRRWYWICPLKQYHATKLYLPNGAVRFASRQTYRLAHQSQRETPSDRAQRRVRKLQRRIGLEPYGDYDWYPKPKGMHWVTFNRICDKIDAAEQIVDNSFLWNAARIFGRYGESG